jgi:hypothetical protein
MRIRAKKLRKHATLRCAPAKGTYAINVAGFLGRYGPKADIRSRRKIGRFGPILLQKSVLQVVCGVLGFLGRAGTVVLRQTAAELRG